jgi:hypothetical protein
MNYFGRNWFNLFYMYITDDVQLELYTNNFGDAKMKEKLYLEVREQKSLNTTVTHHRQNPSGLHTLLRPSG